MERPSPETIAYYDAAVPSDPRATKGQMFGHPCAFVNGNMFFGTFAQSVVARVGTDRTAELARGELKVFEPMAGRAWKEYLQVESGALPPAEIAALAAEALEWTATLPAKKSKAKSEKPARTKSAAKKKAARSAKR
jgi:hypothetical protein